MTIHAGPDDDGSSDIKDGFVSIAKAERMRRAETTRSFRAKNDALYLTAVRASADLKLALQKFEEAKTALVDVANKSGLAASDLIDSINVDSIMALAADSLGVMSKLSFKQAELAAKKTTKAA